MPAYYDYQWYGPAASINTAVVGKMNVVGPMMVSSTLALSLGLSLNGVNIAIELLSPKAFVIVRSLTVLDTPTNCTAYTQSDSTKLLGLWM